MIRMNDITLPLDYNEEYLKKTAAKKLGLSISDIKFISLHKRSVDARKKDNIRFKASVDIKLAVSEEEAVKRCRTACIAKEYRYDIGICRKLLKRPVVVGSGPCGMFAALILAQSGNRPIIIERGRSVDERSRDVALFSSEGILDESSNIQFGEGGAGTFSDGKLNTGTKDSRIRKVLSELAAHGAPEEIMYLAKPHVGTDNLRITVGNIRKTIESLGGEYRFSTKLVGIRSQNGTVTGIDAESNSERYIIDTDTVIMAVGHSARDTFGLLKEAGIYMEQKPFAMGVRIEHLQSMINKSQYGDYCDSPYLGAADYKLAVHLNGGRGVYTFCMCPGGEVVAAASERGRLVTNGMSEFARDKANANSALLVGISPDDFGSSDVLAGVKLQRKLEEQAFSAGGGNYHAPVQRVCDFLDKRVTSGLGDVIPSYRPGVELTEMDKCLPAFMADSLREGIVLMDRKLHGFAYGDAILTAVESRSSSPVRIVRDETMQSVSMKGLYPCGEGAGYAGGIVSAAVDGIKVAEMILHLD